MPLPTMEILPTINDLIVAKITAMVVLGTVSFIIGILPMKLSKLVDIKTGDQDKHLIISLLLCFGGGVLLFTTFLHLQPEVRESLAQLEEEHKIPTFGHGIQTSELVFCLGFFLVYLIEEVVHRCLEKKNEPIASSITKGNLAIPRVTLTKVDDNQISYNVNTSTKELIAVEGAGHGHGHHVVVNKSFRGLLAVLALSFHAVFEGLAVGLETGVDKVWYLFAAIATHKFVIAFCVGVELMASKTKTLLFVVYIGTFAVVSPLGIGIGLILRESGDSQEDVVSAVLQGMAAGTLLYVVFFEVLAREKNNHHGGIWKLLAIFAGFGVMFSLQFLTNHEHSHNHSQDLWLAIPTTENSPNTDLYIK